ncbi:MAG: response regulator [Alkalinema sp. RU_4_3]|nr:response regulator [Alkalinema sp. RU_4_3]
MAKVLLVEDNDVNREMLVRRLAKRGFDMVVAIDGEDALGVARNEQPDIVLMDMSLPVLDGWETTRQLKDNRETAHIPVIALTAHAMIEDRNRCYAAGCDDYDTKPIEIDRLISKIQTLIHRLSR